MNTRGSSSRIRVQRKIMVVDDSEIVRETLREILSQAGFHVCVLESPLGLGRALQADRPDLLLIDLNMPALSGDRAIELVNGNKLHKCPMVIYSDAPEAELHARATAVGAAGYLSKATNPAQLPLSLLHYLQRAQNPS